MSSNERFEEPPFAENDPNVMRAAAVSYAAVRARVVPVFPMVRAPGGGIECGCMKGKRAKARRLATQSGDMYLEPPQCTQAAKHPMIAWKGKKQYGPAQAGRIWDKYPGANIGLVTGSDTGLFVLDVDGEEGMANLAALEDIHGPLPATATVKTGGGGRHYYFFYDGPEIPNSASELAPKIDTRGQSGLIFAPPSNHRSGRRYEWVSA